MNKKVKIALGIVLGAGLIYLGYRIYTTRKSSDKGDATKEKIVYDKASREVVLVENN
jgi:hypothetical protein